MNFKEWEKVSEDNKTVTLKHPKGHQMTIALKGLPKIQQEQLKRLTFAKGGEVDEDGESEQGKTVRHANKMKARGEEHESEMQDAKEEAKGRAAEERHVKPKLKGLAKGGAVAHYDEGADPVSQSDVANDKDQGQPQTQPPVTVVNNISPNGVAPGQPQNPQAPAPAPAAVSQAVPTDAPPIAPTAPKQVNGSSIGAESNQTLQSIENARAAQQDQVKVAASQAAAAEPAAKEQIDSEQELARRDQSNKNMINQKTQEFADYVNKHPIDPRHYQATMGSGAKTAAAIGLFVGGLGTPFGGRNYAFEHLESQIDRDLKAQQQNVDNQKTVLGAWQHQFGDNVISNNLARASMNDIYKQKINLAAIQTGTAQAKINAALATQKLDAESAELRNAAASNATRMGLKGVPPGKAGPQTPGGAGATGGWGSKEPRSDRILSPAAEQKFQWANSKYNTVQSEQEKSSIRDEYLNAKQVDEALDQIDRIFPELQKNATWGGYLANKVDPNLVGGSLAAATGLLGAAGAIPTFGASVAGAIPGAIAAGAAGEALGHGVKQGLRGMGGQQESKYETGVGSMEGIATSALEKAGMTPSDAKSTASGFIPTKVDSAEVAKDKLEKLKQKIISLARKGTLESKNMTNQREK